MDSFIFWGRAQDWIAEYLIRKAKQKHARALYWFNLQESLKPRPIGVICEPGIQAGDLVYRDRDGTYRRVSRD